MLVAALTLLSLRQAIPMRTVWTKAVPSSTDCTLALTDSTAYALGRSGILLAIDLETGRTRAQRALGKLTPAVGTSAKDAVFAVVDGGLWKLRSQDLSTEWKSERIIDFSDLGASIAAGWDDTVAVKRLRGISFFSATDGKTLGKMWTVGFGSPSSVPLYVEGGVAYMSGALALHDPKKAKSGWVADVGQATMSQTPCCDGESIYVTASKGLSRVDVRSGKIIWTVKNCGISPAVCGTTVVTTGGGGLSGYSTADGTKLWTVPQLAAISNALKVGSDKIAVMYYKGSSVRVGVFSITDGQQLQESAHLARWSVNDNPRIFLTKQGTIVGSYWSTGFCLASGTEED